MMLWPHSGFTAGAFLGAHLGLTLLCAIMLVGRDDRKVVSQLVLLGVIVASFKIWLIQNTRQWLDVPPDSIKYQLNGQAIAAHWEKIAVASQPFRLDGLLKLQHISIWSPQADLPYSSVLGTHEWLYAAYLGVWAYITPNWADWAIYSNAALAGFFPACAFGICRTLGSTTKVAFFASALAILDPSAAINGAWLLKDTIACWLILLAIWAGVELLKKPRLSHFIMLSTAIGLVGGVRFVGFLAIISAVICLMAPLLIHRKFRPTCSLASACVLGVILFSVLNSIPSETMGLFLNRSISTVRAVLSGQWHTLVSSRLGDMASSSVDSTVADWYLRLRESPTKAIATAIARTLFAPYPWTLFSTNLGGSGIELYYLSSVMFIACLPGMISGIVLLSRSLNFGSVFIGFVIGIFLVAYIVFMGEWSTRQRVFMMPIYFSLAAIGWADIHRRRRLYALRSVA